MLTDWDKEYVFAMSRRTFSHRLYAIMILKLKACREMGEFMGWLGKKRTESPLGLSDERRSEIFAILRDPSVWAIQKSFGVLILEHLDPDWKKTAPMDVLGHAATRPSSEERLWRKSVLDRDGYQCCKCGSKKRLHAHHLARWADAPHLRLVLENGVTLCRPCHVEAHG